MTLIHVPFSRRTLLYLFIAGLFGTTCIDAAPLQKVVALTGTRPPGTPLGTRYVNFNDTELAAINNAGQVAFAADLGTSYGSWAGVPDSIVPVVLGGDIPSGTTGDTHFSSQANLVLNNGGKVSLQAHLVGNSVNPTTDGFGIWTGAPGAVQLVARWNSPAPGISGATFLPNAMLPSAFNDAGQSAFLASVTGPGIDNTNSTGIWIGTPGSLSVAVRTGSQAPGLPSGVNFGYLSGITPSIVGPALSNNGVIAFNAGMVGTGINTSNERGIWIGQPGSLMLAAREGDAVPGASSGVTFNELIWPVTTNELAQVAFGGTLTGTGVTTSNDSGVWAGVPGAMQLVAREGSQAPGTTSGAKFNAFLGNTTATFTPALSDNGEVAFLADLTGTGVNTTNKSGVWAGTPGNLALIARQGQPAPEAAPGVLFFGFDPTTLVINGRGDAAFYAVVTGNASYGGIWAEHGGALHLVVKTGDQIDVGGGSIRTISQLALYGGVSEGYGSAWNDSGQLVYQAIFTDASKAIIFVSVPEPNAARLMLVGAVGILGRTLLLKSSETAV